MIGSPGLGRPARDRRRWLCLAGLLCLFGPVTAASEPLPALSIDPTQISVSGISSGGYMAVQFAVAHAASIAGVGVFAAGPYRCADDIDSALGACTQGRPETAAAIEATRAAAAADRIDSPTALARQQIWLFSGYNDGVVQQPVTDRLYDYFSHFVPSSQIYYQDTLAAGHAMITADYGANCDLTGGEFINDCDYDGAGLLLQHIHGRLQPPAGELSGRIIRFDQNAFVAGGAASISLADDGYAYVPKDCEAGTSCRLHIAFHGCRQSATIIDDAYYLGAGYNDWADSNRIVVLYPQTQASSFSPFNPKACWDWWGYTGTDFAGRSGAQIQAIDAMRRQLQARSAPVQPTAVDDLAALASDSADDAVALVWRPVQGAAAYQVERADGAASGFAALTETPIQRQSYADANLQSQTLYRYRITALAADDTPLDRDLIEVRTRAEAPPCEIYFSDNLTHFNRDRAFAWFGLTFARGSWDYLGWLSLLSETSLYRDNEGYQRGVCPAPD